VIAKRQLSFTLAVLSVAQLIGWGTVSFIAVAGREMAADLEVDVTTIFAGTTVFYVTMGAFAPILSRLFRDLGARHVMIYGTIVAAFGLTLLSFSHSVMTYFIAWLLLGAAGSATLTTPAHILLNEIAGRKAAQAIATLMLVTGLYATVFWPLSSYLTSEFGWRSACEAYAAMLLLVCLPLYIFCLPPRETAETTNAHTTTDTKESRGSTFYLIVAAIALNAFVTFGFSAIFIELLKAEGLRPVQAVAFGSALGILQIGARGINIVGGKHWDGLTIGTASAVILSLSLIVLLIAQGSIIGIGTFLILYGVGSGALAVARSTIPLVFYDKSDFAKALSRISLPLNWMSAVSPPLLISMMMNYGSSIVLIVATACSCLAIAILFVLMQRRPISAVAAEA